MKTPAFLTAALLTGCSSMPAPEQAWQTLHLVDSLQTLQIARHPECYRELNPILPDHPSPAQVALWSVGTATAHYAVTQLLERRDAPRWAMRTWHAVGLLTKGYIVQRNVNVGVTPWGAEECTP